MNMWDEATMLKTTKDIAETLKEIAAKFGNDDKIYELELKIEQLEKENERLRGILKNFGIPADTDIRPTYCEFQTNYDVRANVTNVCIGYNVDGYFRFVLERDE